MKKYILFILCSCLILFSACSNPNETCINNYSKYYKIYENNLSNVTYEIYDINNKILFSNSTDNPIDIDMISNNIIDVSIGKGSGITVHKFFDIKNKLISDDYLYVLANRDNLVAYIGIQKENPFENRKIIVSDIFKNDEYYKEFEMDFSNVDTPVTKANFSRNGKDLKITYLSGPNQTEKSITLDL